MCELCYIDETSWVGGVKTTNNVTANTYWQMNNTPYVSYTWRRTAMLHRRWRLAATDVTLTSLTAPVSSWLVPLRWSSVNRTISMVRPRPNVHRGSFFLGWLSCNVRREWSVVGDRVAVSSCIVYWSFKSLTTLGLLYDINVIRYK